MLVTIHPDNPDPRKIKEAITCLQQGGLVIYPTDTIYAIGCDLNRPKAIQRLAKLKGIAPEKANFSLLCSDLSQLSNFAKHVSNPAFKLMKSSLPGPYTFILQASNQVPRLFQSKKKTIGIRVPDNNIVQALVEALGNPLVSTSIHTEEDDDIVEYMTDPELIHERYEKQVDLCIDGGYGDLEDSTVIDCTDNAPELIRLGKGEFVS